MNGINGRILFPGNPWPEGHALQEFAWTVRLVDGKVWFDPADNETTELSAGHATFTYDFMPPPATERVTYKSIVNIDYLNQLGTKSS